ncbi:Protein of unknown function, partial [Gryllus bimaculatus]
GNEHFGEELGITIRFRVIKTICKAKSAINLGLQTKSKRYFQSVSSREQVLEVRDSPRASEAHAIHWTLKKAIYWRGLTELSSLTFLEEHQHRKIYNYQKQVLPSMLVPGFCVDRVQKTSFPQTNASPGSLRCRSRAPRGAWAWANRVCFL